MAKTNWTPGDTVFPSDMNDIGQEINDNTVKLTNHIGSGGDAHSVATQSSAGFMSSTDKGKLDGASSAATPNSIIIRDSSGRAKVSSPFASDDIARKDTVDAVQTNLNNHTALTNTAHGATSAATASTLMARDASGRAKVAAPSASDDIATKAYVDAVNSEQVNRLANNAFAESASITDYPVGYTMFYVANATISWMGKTSGFMMVETLRSSTTSAWGIQRVTYFGNTATYEVWQRSIGSNTVGAAWGPWVRVDSLSVQSELSSHIGSGGSAHATATTSAAGFMSASDKSKLDGIASGAEVNQNAFSKVTVGSTTVEADSKTDTLTLAAGDGIALSANANTDTVTISTTSKVATGSFSDTTTSVAAGATYTKTIPLGLAAKKATLYMRGGTSGSYTGATVFCTTTRAQTVAINYMAVNYNQALVYSKSYDGLVIRNGIVGNNVEITDAYISGTNLVLTFYNAGTNAATLSIPYCAWEAEV